MADVSAFAQAIKAAESNGDYNKVQGLVRGNARLLGAYGFPSDEWADMAAAAGIPGARWRDPRAQDYVAEATFERLHRKYQDWRLVAMAWKAGEAVADVVAASPKVLSNTKLKPLASWTKEVMARAGEQVTLTRPVRPDGTPVPADVFKPHMGGFQKGDEVTLDMGQPKAEDALRSRLTALRDHRRAQFAGVSDSEAEATPEPEVT